MLKSKARWQLEPADDRAAQHLSGALNLDPLIAKLLTVRGIVTKEQAELFLYGGPGHFRDPFLLHDMEAAVQRIRLALSRGEKIRIYGDYDADGVSSTALMVHTLKRLGADFDWYIPHRANEGYGLNGAAIEQAKACGVSLIITVDTGISAREEVAYARQLGIDVVVTDHHEPPALLPDACAVVNPKKTVCPYPFKGLAGVGVAFKLAHALLGRCPLEFAELAAIGTIADLMPLVDENRILVKIGLEQMKASAYPGIKAILRVSGIAGEVTAGHVGYALGPRINAGGRLDTASEALKLLITDDPEEAEALARHLDRLNQERQRIVDEMTEQAVLQLEDSLASDKAIVLADEGWNPGVVGIVASRVLEKYYRPTIVLAIDPSAGVAKGSARSIHGFDIYRALTHCGDLLDHFGGHQAAAGLTLKTENIPVLKERLNELAGEWLDEEDFVPVIKADLACALEEIAVSRIELLQSLAPFGPGNPAPKFVVGGAELDGLRSVGKDGKHLKLTLRTRQETSYPPKSPIVDAIGFGLGSLTEEISSSARIDVLGELEINEWNGEKRPQLILKDLRVPHIQIFDWRRAEDPKSRIDLLAAQAERLNRRGTAAILWFASEKEHSFPLRPESSDVFSFWLADDRGGIMPLNDLAESLPYAQVQRLILPALPPGLEWLENALMQGENLERIYAIFAGESYRRPADVPPRESFKRVYGMLAGLKQWTRDDRRLWENVSKRTGLSVVEIRFILEIFEELAFIERDGDCCRLAPNPAKRELSSSRRYQALSRQAELERILIRSETRELRDWMLGMVGKSKVMEGTG